MCIGLIRDGSEARCGYESAFCAGFYAILVGDAGEDFNKSFCVVKTEIKQFGECLGGWYLAGEAFFSRMVFIDNAAVKLLESNIRSGLVKGKGIGSRPVLVELRITVYIHCIKVKTDFIFYLPKYMKVVT